VEFFAELAPKTVLRRQILTLQSCLDFFPQPRRLEERLLLLLLPARFCISVTTPVRGGGKMPRVLDENEMRNLP